MYHSISTLLTVQQELPTELWIKVFTYLPHADLQQLRLVCKSWMDIVSLPEFISKSKLRITKNNLSAIYNHLQNKDSIDNADEADDTDNADLVVDRAMYMRYQTIELIGLKCSEDLQYILSTIGKYVRSLTLQKSPIFENLHIDLPNLEELAIRCIRMMPDGDNLQTMNLNEFAKLKSFELACSGLARDIKTRLLQQLTRHLTTLRLERFFVEYSSEQEELLLYVLESHADSLKCINLNFYSTPALDVGMWQRLFEQFHQLDTIKLTGNCHYEWLEAIFNSLPAMTPLKVIDFSGLLHANDTLLTNIVRKWAHTLQQVNLMFCTLFSDVGAIELGQLRNNIQMLNFSYCRNITKRGILGGIADYNGCAQMQQLYFNDLILLDEQSVCVLAEQLPNLLKLSLENCSSAVTDNALAKIFCHQTRLQHLTLDDCIRISDEGLLGFGTEPYSISRLQGLQVLSLRGCRNLTNRSLMHAFKFNDLRSLKFGYCHKISAQGFVELVANCPTVDDLVISSCLMLDDDAILHIVRGLKRLRQLNVSNCLNLTEQSIDHITRYCESLEELTLCGIDSLELSDVQQRLTSAKPHIKDLHI